MWAIFKLDFSICFSAISQAAIGTQKKTLNFTVLGLVSWADAEQQLVQVSLCYGGGWTLFFGVISSIALLD